MMSLVDLSLRHRLVVILLAILLVVVGAQAFRQLPIDAFPDVTNIQVTVISHAATLSPLEMEQLVTYPIEQACSGLPYSTQVRSLSKYGLSIVTVVFEDGTDIYFARQLVLERMLSARDGLPGGVESNLGPISTGLGEVYQYTLESPERSQMELRTLQDWVVRPILRTVPGVAGADSFGGFVRQFHVVVDPTALRRFDLTIGELADAVAANNGVAGGAYVERGGEQYVVRGDGWIRDLDDLGETVVAFRNNVPILLRQLARLEIGPEIRQGAISKDGQGEAVAGIILMLRGASGREVVDAIESRMEDVRQSLPDDVEIVPFYDRNVLVRTALATVQSALLQGAALVVLVLLFFMGNPRSALLVALQLPMAAMATFAAMQLLGMSSNLMTLSGLAIAIGMLGDGAIVLVENTVRMLRDRCDHPEASCVTTVRDAAAEVIRPIVFGIAVIIVVFLPIASLQGLEGKMFAPLAYTISLALGASLILSVTVIPALASLLLARFKPKRNRFDLTRLIYRFYAPQLRFALDHEWLPALGAAVLVVIAALIAPTLGTEFLPSMDEGSIVVQPFQLPSVSLNQSLEIVRGIEQAILELPEAAHVVSRTGRSDISSDPMGVGESDIFVELRPRDEWTTSTRKEDLVAALRGKLTAFPGVEFGYTQPIQMRVDELISGVKSQIAVKIFGDDLDTLVGLGDHASEVLATISGAADIKAEAVEGLGYLEITMRRRQMSRLGISVAQVRNLIETAMGGRVITTVPEGDRRIDVSIRLSEEFTAQVDNLRNLPLLTPTGERVLLSEVATIALTDGPAQISRESGRRRLVVELNVVGRDIGGFVAEAQERLSAELELPTGYWVSWGGQFEQQQRAMARLRLMVPLSLLLIAVLLYLNFRGIGPALLILVNIPLAMVGGVIGLKLSGLYLSVSASVGFIALFGIAILNGLVMIEFFARLEADGMERRQAIMEGVRLRLRPVLMTAATTGLGLLPLVWASGVGSEIQRPLAVVVVSGVATSTFLTLMVLPVLYQRFGSRPPAAVAAVGATPIEPD